MTQMTSANPVKVPARSNIYTVLALVGVLALAVGIGFVVYKNNDLTGKGNPFEVLEPIPLSQPVSAAR